MKKKKKSKLKDTDFVIGLEHNALSSLSHGIEHFVDRGTTDNIKFAIIHIFHAVELFLKARLAKEHELLIYAKPEDKIDDNAFTVNFNTLIKRLENSGVTFSKTDLCDLHALRLIRNSIEHHKIKKNREDVKFYIGRTARFLETFLKNELDIALKDEIDESVYRTLAEAIYSYEERLQNAKNEIEELLPVDLKDRSTEYEFVICNACGEETVVIPDPRSDGSGEKKTHCFFCGEKYFYDHCNRCGSPVLSLQELKYDDYSPCSDCWHEIMSSDKY